MRIGLDVTALLPERTGVDTYLFGLVQGLTEIGDHSVTLYANAEDAIRLPSGPPFTLRLVSRRPRVARLIAQQLALPALARRDRLDVLHSPSFIAPLLGTDPVHVLTIHDMTSFTLPHVHNRLRRSGPYRAAVRASIARADGVCVPSSTVREAVVELLPRIDPAAVRVVRHGIDGRFRPGAARPALLQALGVQGPYVLCVGTLQPRKNLPNLLEAFARLVRRGLVHDLVLVGQFGWGEDLRARVGALGLTDCVHMAGWVDDDALPGLYCAADALACPSIEEGFSLPPIEAIACGTAVVASDIPAHCETLRGAARLVDPRDVDGIADGLASVLLTDGLRDRLRAAGMVRAREFQWRRCAEQTIEVYADARARRTRAGRRGIAR